ncbi:MAG: hypothetical protein ACT4PW_08485 [Acidimicrobiia bacterium]
MSLDWRAVAVGAGVGVALAVPAAAIGGLLDVGALLAVILVGWVVAGFVAASKRPDLPYSHGLVAGVTTAALLQLVNVVVSLATGDPVSVLALAFNLMVAAVLGTFGALIASKR